MYTSNRNSTAEIELRQVFPTDRPIEVLRFLHAEASSGVRCALVTLTEIIDGASRPIGAHMAVTEDGRYCGMVSGGCVEAAAAREALLALAKREDRSCRFGKGSSFFDIVLPCGGGIVLSIHVVTVLCPIVQLLDALANRQPGSLAYDAERQKLAFQPGLSPTGWHGGLFRSSYRPEPAIVLSGNNIEARSFASVANAAGLNVIMSDVARTFLKDDPEQVFVLLHHDLEHELPVLREALATPAFFIGCLGSRRTHTARVAVLREEGYSQEQLDRIRAPIGLFGPSREANSVAVSVLAQIFAILEERRQ
ncbi:XdhC family protein [Agrobacterium pusense]|uniref:XdhC family protein n=1 Tax=Agrobacterium pusense TaxID=648995 RepID=UPI003FD5B0D9